MGKDKNRNFNWLQASIFFFSVIIVILTVLLTYRDLSLKIGKLDREMGEIKTEVTCCFDNIEARLSSIEEKIDYLNSK